MRLIFGKIGTVVNMAPSSSGPGHLVLIQKIAGSIPAGVTNEKDWFIQSFLFVILREENLAEQSS